MTAISLSIATYLARDIVGLSSFYAKVFDLKEIEELRSEIFRGLDLEGTTLGFSAEAAYELLGIADRANPTGTSQYLTFETDADQQVTTLTDLAISYGATLLHEPYETYYGAYQSVLADPENNVFRINHFR